MATNKSSKGVSNDFFVNANEEAKSFKTIEIKIANRLQQTDLNQFR